MVLTLVDRVLDSLTFWAFTLEHFFKILECIHYFTYLYIYMFKYLYFSMYLFTCTSHTSGSKALINEKQIQSFLLIFRLDLRNSFLVYTERNLPISAHNNLLDNFLSSFRKLKFLKAVFCTSFFHCLFANYRCKISSLLLLDHGKCTLYR